jgi:short-subunit dehydrogenase
MNLPIRDWQGKRVWIIGASSGIGAATARLLLSRGALVGLSARNVDKLQEVSAAHANASIAPLDVTDIDSIRSAHAGLLTQWQAIDLVLIVAGSYVEMRADSFDLAAAQKLVDTNLNGVLRCLDVALPGLLQRGAGGIGIVSSVAGYRGLPKALAYGPGKAALINLCESLFLDLRPRGISVYLITPGFVETPLTAGNDFPMPALMSPEQAAQELVAGVQRGDFLIHFPRRFTNVVRLMRLLPYRLYFALTHKATGL